MSLKKMLNISNQFMRQATPAVVAAAMEAAAVIAVL